MEKLQSWLTIIVSGLVSNPDQVSITASEDEQGLLFIVSAAHQDMGKIIGKKGVISEALKTLVRCAGYVNDIRCAMKIEDPK